MNPDAMLELLGKQGWDLFDPKAQQSMQSDMRRQADQLLAEAATLAAPFANDAGRRCLDMLVQRTLLRPLVPVHGGAEPMTAEAYGLYAARREGQNQIVAMILNAIAADKGVEAPVKEG